MISQEIEYELEALRSIYCEDFIEREPVWKRPCFSIRVKPTTSTSGKLHVEATIKFTLVSGYPKVAPKVELEESRGLSASDVKTLSAKLQEVVTLNVGQEMCHEVVACAQQFLEANNVQPQSFYDAMISREKRESEALKSLRAKETSSDGKKVEKKHVRPFEVPNQLPNEGVIDANSQQQSVIDSSQTDFKQPTEFLSQQRLLNMTSKSGWRSAASTRGGPSSRGGFATHEASESAESTGAALAEDSSILNNSKSASGRARGAKSWLQLFSNPGNDDDADDVGEEEEGNPDAAQRSVPGDNRLVPVIGRVGAELDSSRYRQEFVEMSRLGSGASGQVWKVRNKLDRRIYAVKKIDLNAAENASVGQAKIRREVTTISRLLHKHIVRYYAAWVEETECAGPCAVEGTEDGNVTATLTMGASNSFGTSSTSSALQKGPKYLSAVVGGGADNRFSAYGVNTLDEDFSNMYSKDPDQLWTFDATEVSAPALAPSAIQSYKQKATGSAGSRFFRYGGDSSSSNDSDDSSESDSDSEGSSSDGSSSDEGDETSAATPVTVQPQDGIAVSGALQADSKGGSQRRSGVKASAGPKMRRWMFIQMEYCYTTLREVIDQGQLWQQPAECGKWLRQLLEALVYIHARRVIHRDLKPANIFLDGEGNIKIGDFGLATFTTESTVGSGITASSSNAHLYNLRSDTGSNPGEDSMFMSRDASTQSLSQMDAHESSADALLSNSLTGGIGTAMYRAPEQEYRPRDASSSGADKGYDDKADMFSLGVILFEMCHPPFGTGMERLLVMKKLRDNAELPADFGTSFSTESLGSVVRWLVQQQPTQRPSASQLLNSSLVPARVDTDSRYLKEITEALWKPNSSAAAGIISVLFNNSVDAQKLVSSGPAPPGTAAVTASRAQQDNLPSVSYDLEVLQQSLNTLQPRAIPRSPFGGILTTGSSKSAKQMLRLALQKQRSVVTLQYTNSLKQRLRKVFETHGALPYVPGLLQLHTNPGLMVMMRNADRAVARHRGQSSEEALNVRNPALAQFLDPTGQVVVLPSDLVTPFAKLVAFLNLQHSQRYAISQVYTSQSQLHGTSIEDAPVAATHDHPFISEEAVYDVVLPHPPVTGAHSEAMGGQPDSSPVLRADWEVLSAAIEAVSRVQNFLPDCAVRVNDPRIMDAIIELCCWNLEVDAVSTTAGPEESISGAMSRFDREALFKIISLAADGVISCAEVASMVSELAMQPYVRKRILAFAPVFCAAQSRRASHPSETASYLHQGANARDPLQLLDALEQEFYRSEVIVDFQRKLAAGPTAVAAPAADKKKDKVIVKPHVANTSAISDFTQLDLAHIGEKKQSGRKKDTQTASAGIGKPPTVPVAKIAHVEEIPAADTFKEDRRRIRTIIKTFDSALSHLRQLVKAALNCMYGTQQAQQNNPATIHGATASLLLIVDLGKDPRYISSRAGSSMLCPFHAKGMYFVVEAYLFPSEQFMQQQLQVAKDKGKSLGTQDPELLLRCSRRRHNRFGGVLGEGGHFEHLVEAYRDHFQQVGSGDGDASHLVRPPPVTACALRLKLDVITQLIVKYESRQRRVVDHLQNRANSSKYHFVNRFSSNLSDFLDFSCSLDALLAVEQAGGGVSGVSTTLQSMLLLLRRHGIRASDRPHQLHGASHSLSDHIAQLDSVAATALCTDLGIPFVVILHPDTGNSITLKYCGDENHSQNVEGASVLLLDLPHVLLSCLRDLEQADRSKFSLQAVLAKQQSTSDNSLGVRSPGRATSSAGSTTGAGGIAAGDFNPSGPAAGGVRAHKVRFGSFDIKNPSTSSSASNADGSAAAGDSTPATPSGSARALPEKVVQLVFLDNAGGVGGGGAQGGSHNKDWQHSNPKEKKQAVMKKKDVEQVPMRVREMLLKYHACSFAVAAGTNTGAGSDIPSLTTLVRLPSTPYSPGMVLVLDAPFALLRNLSTILMTRLHSAMSTSAAREEYDALASTAHSDATGGANNRKILKQTVFQLVGYAKQVVNGLKSQGSGQGIVHAATGKAGGGASSASTSGGQQMSSSSTAQQGHGAATATGELQLFLYSLGDHQMDYLVCDAKALLNAKLVT